MSAPSLALQNSWSLVGVISSDHGQSIAVVKHKPSNKIHTLREGEMLASLGLQFIQVLPHDSIKAIWRGKPIIVSNDGSSQYDLVDHEKPQPDLPAFEESPEITLVNLPAWQIEDLVEGVEWNPPEMAFPEELEPYIKASISGP